MKEIQEAVRACLEERSGVRAVTAIARSVRGVLAVALAGEEGPSVTAYRILAEVSEENYNPADYRLLKLAFQAGPSRVLILRTGGQEESFTLLETVKYDWLAAPRLD